MRAMRGVVPPMLEAYGVDLVLNGHGHGTSDRILIDTHHGTSSTLDPGTTTLDQGNGDPLTATARTGARPGPSLGAVFEVAGSSVPA